MPLANPSEDPFIVQKLLSFGFGLLKVLLSLIAASSSAISILFFRLALFFFLSILPSYLRSLTIDFAVL